MIFPTRLSVLADDGLRDWLSSSYNLPASPECRLVSLSLNDVYSVVAGDLRAFLRIYRHDWRTREEVDAELAFVLDLAANGVAVSVPIPFRDGDYVGLLNAAEGPRFAVLWTEAPGDNVRDITSEHARRYGRLAAAIHVAADRSTEFYLRGPHDAAHLIDEPLAAIRAALPDSDDLAELEGVAALVCERLNALASNGSDYGLCHGDMHPGNVRFAADGTPTVFDFDCCGYGWRGYDLAVFLWNAYGEGRGPRWRKTRWRAFLRGYAELRPLPAGLDEHLPWFMIARQIWLTGLDFAGQSGYPPQWVGPGLLRTALTSIRGWQTEYSLSL